MKRSRMSTSRLTSLFVVATLAITSPRVLGWNDGPPPAEEEYFGNRLRQHEQGVFQQQEGPRPVWWKYVAAVVVGYFAQRLWGNRKTRDLKKDYERQIATLTANHKMGLQKTITAKQRELDLAKAQLAHYQNVLEELQRAAMDAGVSDAVISGKAAISGSGGAAAVGGGGGDTQVELDYEEFKQPDTNNDNQISRLEFNKYIHNYLEQYPEVAMSELPRFEDFDVNRNGQVSFAEWEAYLEETRRLEEEQERKKKYQGGSYGSAYR